MSKLKMILAGILGLAFAFSAQEIVIRACNGRLSVQPFANARGLAILPKGTKITDHVLEALQPGFLSRFFRTGSGGEAPQPAKMLKELYDVMNTVDRVRSTGFDGNLTLELHSFEIASSPRNSLNVFGRFWNVREETRPIISFNRIIKDYQIKYLGGNRIHLLKTDQSNVIIGLELLLHKQFDPINIDTMQIREVLSVDLMNDINDNRYTAADQDLLSLAKKGLQHAGAYTKFYPQFALEVSAIFGLIWPVIMKDAWHRIEELSSWVAYLM